MIHVLLVALAISAPHERPEPAPRGESECSVVELKVGEPIPESLLILGVSRCNGLVMPESEVLSLYSVEIWADKLEAEYRLDVAALDLEVKHYKQAASTPIPWRDKPETQRWFGRADVIVPVAIGIIVSAIILGAR